MLKVKMYRSTQYQAVDEIDVLKITAMPEPNEITDEDKLMADGIMLGLWLPDGGSMFIPHSFLIEVKEANG